MKLWHIGAEYLWEMYQLKIFNESECVIQNKFLRTAIGWKAYECVRRVSESIITARFTRKENHLTQVSTMISKIEFRRQKT